MSLIEIEKSEFPLRTIGIDLYVDSLHPFIVISILKYNIFIRRILNENEYIENKR